MRGIRIFCEEDGKQTSYDYLIADHDSEYKIRKIFSSRHKNCTVFRTELMPRADIRTLRNGRYSY